MLRKLFSSSVKCAALLLAGVVTQNALGEITTNAIFDAGVNVGYQVSGLEGDEVAVVFTNDACEVINWTVPARLENVQFLVVGGGGGGGGFARSHYGFASSNGGNGGSGIVVFRFKNPIQPGFKVIVR